MHEHSALTGRARNAVNRWRHSAQGASVIKIQCYRMLQQNIKTVAKGGKGHRTQRPTSTGQEMGKETAWTTKKIHQSYRRTTLTNSLLKRFLPWTLWTDLLGQTTAELSLAIAILENQPINGSSKQQLRACLWYNANVFDSVSHTLNYCPGVLHVTLKHLLTVTSTSFLWPASSLPYYHTDSPGPEG